MAESIIDDILRHEDMTRGGAVVAISVPLGKGDTAGGYIRLLTDDLNKHERWVRVPASELRDPYEVRATRRFHWEENQPSETDKEAHVEPDQPSPEPPDWVRRTVQALDGDTTDPLLYALFARSVAVLGSKPADQLFIMQLKRYSALTFQPDEENEDRTEPLAIFDLTVFAVLKAVSPSKPRHIFRDFSPVISIVGVLSPITDAADPARLLNVCCGVDVARLGRLKRKSRYLTELLKHCFSEHFLPNFRDGGDLVVALQGGGMRTLRETGVKIGKLQVTTYIGHVLYVKSSSAEILVDHNLLSEDASTTRHSLFTLFQRLLAPGYKPTLVAPQGKHVAQECRHCRMKLDTFCRRSLPEQSCAIIAPNSIGILSAGRRLQLVFGHDAAARATALRDAVAWNVLLLSLIAMQDGLLASYHRRLASKKFSRSDGALSDLAESAIEDFGDYYDVGLFNSLRAAFFRDAYERMQVANGIDHQYEMLRERLNLALGRSSVESLKTVRKHNLLLLVTLAAVIVIPVALEIAKAILRH